ncbi:hypothetical protein L8W55_04065 [Campylobacter sp. FU_520]|uniref:hypothetical protein n=1 Tax=Campylobacter sp. FU_520 TaxID=2911611 RepID=UPI0021E6C5A7|nr:hypothetical protein [Campylobacter sp. FU_520]MCV3453970.1 hypothetical protein [Campylobacter sp. FU_520]
MAKKQIKVVLFGGSNSIIKNGLQKGLQQENVLLCNFALGATTSIQNLYELIRRQDEVKNADLIITESNVNDSFSSNLNTYRNLNWFYEEIYKTNKKILVLILPYYGVNIVNTNRIHRKLIEKYGFNYIDMQEYYDLHNLGYFAQVKGAYGIHQCDFIMRKLGENIIKNIKNFSISRKIIDLKNPTFLVHPASEFKHQDIFEIENSMFKEKYCRIKKGDALKFTSRFYGCYIVAYHTWNNTQRTKITTPSDWLERRKVKSKLILNNKDRSYYAKPCLDNIFYETGFWPIDDTSKVEVDFDDLSTVFFNHVDLISFFIIENNGEIYTDNVIYDEFLCNEMEIPKEYNFNHLIPSVEWYKEIIDEYCSAMDPIKLQPLQNQISALNSKISLLEQNKVQLSQEKDKVQQDNIILKQTLNSLPIKKQQLEISNLEQDLINKKLQTKQLSKKLGIKVNDFMPKITMINPASAKARIQNQLSYKLGQAMIVNSKSFLGYIRMPFVLSYIKDKHKQEQKIYQEKIKKDPSLALPPLESYPDYQEALKFKNHLSYKLGQALIQANKTWYGGGYIKLLFKIRKLKKQYIKKGVNER